MCVEDFVFSLVSLKGEQRLCKVESALVIISSVCYKVEPSYLSPFSPLLFKLHIASGVLLLLSLLLMILCALNWIILLDKTL